MTKQTVDEYFQLPESLKPMELVFGVVREPPAPRYGHQSAITRLAALLHAHVRDRDLGEVCVSPVDVVLDREAALVVQPDIVFLAKAHLNRIEDRIWGAPDLVVEVLSPGTALRDRTTKLGWYVRYGVAECWLVDVRRQTIEVIDTARDPMRRTTFHSNDAVRSMILPEWHASPADVMGM